MRGGPCTREARSGRETHRYRPLRPHRRGDLCVLRGTGGGAVTFDDDWRAVEFGDRKINLHPVDNDVDHVAADPTPGRDDFCLLTEDAERRLGELGIDVVTGPVERTGAVGQMTSIYVRDPDGNPVELARYDRD